MQVKEPYGNLDIITCRPSSYNPGQVDGILRIIFIISCCGHFVVHQSSNFLTKRAQSVLFCFFSEGSNSNISVVVATMAPGRVDKKCV